MVSRKFTKYGLILWGASWFSWSMFTFFSSQSVATMATHASVNPTAFIAEVGGHLLGLIPLIVGLKTKIKTPVATKPLE